MSRTTYIVTIHDTLDPACCLHRGARAWWGFRWLFRCGPCRKEADDDR